ncbi:hypothetical protein ACFLZM_00430 [Thermodesulfobacteriota bacterium]
MNNTLNKLTTWFEQKGLHQQDLPYFIKDVIQFIDTERHSSLQSLNQELESLGWGIQLMDETAYKQMLFLHRNRNASS